VIKELNLHLSTLHPNQQKVLDLRKRFNTLCCGRRWGKTKLAEELMLSPDDETNGALNGLPIAYFAPTYKMLMEVWRSVVNICSDITESKSEVEKRLQLIGGGVIDFWSLDTPDTIRGRKYKRVIVDEAATVSNLKYSWTEVIRPLLTDLKGDAWFLSTPKGKNNYFYDLSTNSEKYADWIFWQMPTVSNPYIDPAEVEEARLQLDPLTFAQEYLASFITENLDSWAYCYSRAKHVGRTELNRSFDVKLSFDFNRNPITCGVFQDYGNEIRGIEQIKLENSNIYNLCDYILAKYGGCLFTVTGDATGRGSTALVKDNLNYYTVIKSKLNLSINQIKVHTINPSLEENRVLVNSILHTKKVTFDEINCKGLIFDLEHAQVLPDGSLDKTDRKDPTKQLDALDCFRYYLNTFHKHALKL
jgi:hypothetical protein